jgi:uncharacterized protein YkwD
MASPAALLALLLGLAAGASVEPVSGGQPIDLLIQLNRLRADQGLPPLALAEALSRVAQERARELSDAGSLDPEEGAIVTLSRRLLAAGYQAHTWEEHAVATDGEVTEAWRQNGGESLRQTIRGDFTELGIGIARGPGLPVYTFLFALPKRAFFAREAAPLLDLATVRQQVLARVNEARRAAGLSALDPDPRLDVAAQLHASDMLERAYYSHESPEGLGPMERLEAAGYAARHAGENIAKGLFSPVEVVDRWMNSRGHRHNLLARDFASLGVGVAVGGEGDGFEVVWVQVFGAESRRRP